MYTGIDPTWPKRSKFIAIVLAFFLGDLGIHHFYLGHFKKGILHLCFCWCAIPEIISIITGIRWLIMNDEKFMKENEVRV